MDNYKKELQQRSQNAKKTKGFHSPSSKQYQTQNNHNNPETNFTIRKNKHPYLGHFFIWGGFILMLATLITFAIVNVALKAPTGYSTSALTVETTYAQLISPEDTPQPISSQTSSRSISTNNDNQESSTLIKPDEMRKDTRTPIETVSSRNEFIKTFLNFGLGLVGFLALILVIVGPLIGFSILGNKITEPGMELDPRSGKGPHSEVPNEVKGWNWGAFMFTPFWGLYFKLPLTLLALIPYVNIVIAFVYAIKGKEMAWKKQPWLSTYEFNHFQNKWNIAGLVLFLFMIGVPLVFLILSIAF